LTITNRRVLARQGFFRRRTFEVPPAWLATITVDETLLGQMLGHGTVTLRGTAMKATGFQRSRARWNFAGGYRSNGTNRYPEAVKRQLRKYRA
jgi:Bacterial PH domain